jgi:hypothetical protein
MEFRLFMMNSGKLVLPWVLGRLVEDLLNRSKKLGLKEFF